MSEPTGLASGDVSVALLLAAWLVLVTGPVAAFDVAGRFAAASRAGGGFRYLPGLALGLATWTGIALLILDHAPGSARFDVLPLAAAVVLATIGGAEALRQVSLRPTDTMQLVVGAGLGSLAVAVAMLLIVAGHGHWPGIDVVILTVTLAGAIAAMCTVTMIARLPVGYGADVGAGIIYASTLALATYSLSHAMPELPAGDVREPASWGVSVDTLAVLAVLGAAGCLLIGLASQLVEGQLRRASEEDRLAAVSQWQNLTKEVVGDTRPSLRALTHCLDLMASEPLSLPQRRRLDAARDCAAELAALLVAASELVAERPVSAAAPVGSALVVDDSEMHRGIARIVLERAGFDVRLAVTAGAAIDDLRRAPVDVAFVDAHMPGMDGFALTEALRADPALAGTIVIGLSTNVEDDRDDARAADMDDLVAKPLCRSTVAAVVSRWLAPAAAEALAGRPAGAAEPSVAA